MRRYIICFLCLLLLLCACSAHPDSKELTQKLHSQQSAEPAQEQPEPVVSLTLRYQALPLPADVGVAQGQCLFDGRVYSFANRSGPVIGYTTLTGETGTLDVPAEMEYIHAICAADGQLAVLAGSYPQLYEDASGALHEPEQLRGEYELLLYASDGTLDTRIPLEQCYREQSDSFDDLAYLNGSYYLMSPHRLTRIGSDGKELARTQLDTQCNYHQLDVCGESLLLGVGSLTTLQSVCRIDAQTLAVESEFSLDGKTLTGLGRDADGALLVCDAENTVRRVNWQEQSGEKVFSWSENAQTSAQNYLRFYELDGLWLALEQNTSVVSIYRVYDGAPPEKIRLTLTQVGDFDGLSTLVDDFNRASEEYEIALIYSDAESYDENLLRVQAELTTAPSDLYAGRLSGNLPMNAQAFADLKPWLEADSETRDALVPNFWQRLSRDGACYCLPYEFSLRTWLGEAALFDHAGITLDALERTVADSPYDYPLDGIYRANVQLNELASLSAELYVDAAAGDCRFTDPSFIRLLELCLLAGEDLQTQQVDAVVKGEYFDSCALHMRHIQSAASIPKSMTLYTEDGSREVTDFTYVGYPNDLCTGTAFELGQSLAVSVLSEHKDGAWAFIQFALSEQEQGKGIAFPVNDAALRRSVDERLSLKAISQDDAQRFYDALYSTTILYSADQTVMQIVLDEGAAFLDGLCTAEQAAQNMDARIGLYLMEQTG